MVISASKLLLLLLLKLIGKISFLILGLWLRALCKQGFPASGGSQEPLSHPSHPKEGILWPQMMYSLGDREGHPLLRVEFNWLFSQDCGNG